MKIYKNSQRTLLTITNSLIFPRTNFYMFILLTNETHIIFTQEDYLPSHIVTIGEELSTLNLLALLHRSTK